MKHRLWDMSWKEAEEAFRACDMAILPVGTLHGHGPTPISIDSSSVEWLADEVGKRTGIVTMPLVPYGENDKQKYYPGSICIMPDTLERFYLDILRSLHRNGVRKVLVLNGHGGNRESMIRAAKEAREFGVVTAIVEWWNVVTQLMPELNPEGGYHIMELAVALAVGGKDIADLRGTGYKGEWGDPYSMRNIFGDALQPVGFNTFTFKGAKVIVPVPAWDVDVEGPPVLGREVVDELHARGEQILSRLVDYLADFANALRGLDVSEALRSMG